MASPTMVGSITIDAKMPAGHEVQTIGMGVEVLSGPDLDPYQDSVCFQFSSEQLAELAQSSGLLRIRIHELEIAIAQARVKNNEEAAFERWTLEAQLAALQPA